MGEPGVGALTTQYLAAIASTVDSRKDDWCRVASNVTGSWSIGMKKDISSKYLKFSGRGAAHTYTLNN